MIINTIFVNVFSMSLVATFSFGLILLARKILDKKVNIQMLSLLWFVFVTVLIVPINFSSIFSYKNFIDLSKNEEREVEINISETIKENNFDDELFYNYPQEQKVKSDELCFMISCFWLIITSTLILKDDLIYFNLSNKKYFESNDKLNKILVKQKDKLKIKKDIEIVIHKRIKTPSLYGISNVKIFMPEEINYLDNEELEMIITHELIHYKNRHHIIYLLLKLLENMHWFNPVIKVANNFLRGDLECLVDEKVISNAYDRVKYSKTILKSIDFVKFSRLERNLLPGIYESKKSLERRIINMKNNIINTKSAIILAVVAIALISMFTLSFASEKIEVSKISEIDLNEIGSNVVIDEKVVKVVNPLKKIDVSATFGERVHPVLGTKMYHSGIDLIAENGEEIYAIMDGEVIVSTFDSEKGNYISIKHSNGMVSSYHHGLKILVEEGTIVKAGETIMEAGATGNATGVHLHFELKNADGEYVDVNSMFE